MIESEVKLPTGFQGVVQTLSRGLAKAFRDAGAVHTRAMTQKVKSGGSIQTRTGALRRSFGFETRGEGLALELRVFSAGVPYANVQEYGGVIRPKNKRYLTIPLDDAKTPGGALKGGAKLVQRGNKYETADGAPTFIFRSKRGNLLIGSRARNGSLRLLYTLKPSVTLKPRLGFRETFETTTRPFLEERMRRLLA